MEDIIKEFDKIKKVIAIYYSDGKEHSICPICGIDFEKMQIWLTQRLKEFEQKSFK